MKVVKNLRRAGTLCGICFALQIQAQQQNTDDLKINQIQVIGTHNSYARPVDPKLMAIAQPIITQAMGGFMANMPAAEKAKFDEYHPNGMQLDEGLRYDHPPLTDQLDSGLRSLELDVYYDPNGGRFADPAGYRVLREKGAKDILYVDKTDLDKPGFKLLHMADLDVRTYHTTLKSGLREIKAWSDQHPDHAPLFIMIEAKESGFPIFPNPTQVLKYDKAAFEALDKEILDIIGQENIIRPDDVRGSYTTLREAVLAKNWPKLSGARGKFVFLLLPTTAGMGKTGGEYIVDAPNLENRVMFAQSSPEDSYGAFLLLDNALVRQEEIQRYVSEGFLVRTRADIETYEAKVEDYTRSKAAFSSGAQVISTDFFRLPNTYGNSYHITLPEGNREYRVNPVNGK